MLNIGREIMLIKRFVTDSHCRGYSRRDRWLRTVGHRSDNEHHPGHLARPARGGTCRDTLHSDTGSPACGVYRGGTPDGSPHRQ